MFVPCSGAHGSPRRWLDGGHAADASEVLELLAGQGYRLFTPEGTRSSIVTYYPDREPAQVKAAFERERITVSVREAKQQVRVSPALFNTREDIARFLEVSKRLV